MVCSSSWSEKPSAVVGSDAASAAATTGCGDHDQRRDRREHPEPHETLSETALPSAASAAVS